MTWTRPKPPAYRQRDESNLAVVTLTDSLTKRRRDYYLGDFGPLTSRKPYGRLIAQWESAGRRLPELPGVAEPGLSTAGGHPTAPARPCKLGQPEVARLFARHEALAGEVVVGVLPCRRCGFGVCSAREA